MHPARDHVQFGGQGEGREGGGVQRRKGTTKRKGNTRGSRGDERNKNERGLEDLNHLSAELVS